VYRQIHIERRWGRNDRAEPGCLESLELVEVLRFTNDELKI
jgi:hypothetical protein